MSIGSWEAEYQQNPILVAGGQLPIDKLITVPFFDKSNITASVRYIDKAATMSDDAAYTAMVLMHYMKDKTYVIEDVVRGRWSALQREEMMKTLTESLSADSLSAVQIEGDDWERLPDHYSRSEPRRSLVARLRARLRASLTAWVLREIWRVRAKRDVGRATSEVHAVRS